MALGAPDSNGIWHYGADDPRVPFQDTLNLLSGSVSSATAALKSRIQTLEVYDDLGAIGSPFVAASGWSLATNQGRKKAGFAWVRVQVSRTGSAITVPGDGDIPTTLLATFASGWAPASGMLYPAVPTSLAHVGIMDASGVNLTAVAPGITLPVGAVVSFTGCYPLG